jgi:hypothetical protein
MLSLMKMGYHGISALAYVQMELVQCRVRAGLQARITAVAAEAVWTHCKCGTIVRFALCIVSGNPCTREQSKIYVGELYVV